MKKALSLPELEPLLAAYKRLPAAMPPPDDPRQWDDYRRTVWLVSEANDYNVTRSGTNSTIEDYLIAARPRAALWDSFEDTSDLTGHQPMPPHELQEHRVWQKDFKRRLPVGVAYEAHRITSNLCLNTYADILALGAAGITDQVRTQGIMNRARADKRTSIPWLLGAIGLTTFIMTGHRLEKTRTPLQRLHQYYDDITRASPAVALPYGMFRCCQDLGLRLFARGETIGSLQNASNSLLGRYATQSICNDGVALWKFARHYLQQDVVEPFEQTKPGTPRD